MALTQWFNFGLSVSVVKKLIKISLFVTKVPFVALKLILSNSFCMITCFKSVFLESLLCTYCFIYTCALFYHFYGSIFTKKGYYSRKLFIFSACHETIGVWTHTMKHCPVRLRFRKSYFQVIFKLKETSTKKFPIPHKSLLW